MDYLSSVFGVWIVLDFFRSGEQSHQWLSGKRLEVSAGVFSLIFTPFNTMVAMTIPAVYAVLGFTSDLDVLYNDAFRNKIFLVSIAIVLASTILSIIPFLFYDLTAPVPNR